MQGGTTKESGAQIEAADERGAESERVEFLWAKLPGCPTAALCSIPAEAMVDACRTLQMALLLMYVG